MSEPTTEAGRALLEAFQRIEPGGPDFAIRLNSESVVRHAIPRIEAEARAAVLRELREEVAGMPSKPNGYWIKEKSEVISQRAVLAAIDRRLGA